MSKKKGNFIDQYLDKIILGLTVIAALYLLWAFVLSNPYGEKAGSRKLSPAEIDSMNLRQAQQIQEKLAETAAPQVYDKNKAVDMANLLEDPMPKVSALAVWPLPGGGQTGGGGDRQYYVPQIPLLSDVKMASIRGTVMMPTDEVTPEVTYVSVASKPEDLDLVTFSARINLESLFDNFKQSFMGPRLKPQWRDPMLAEPVVARIELQRSSQNPDGSWSEWEAVPFMRIDPYQKIKRDIPLTTEQMTYGNIELFMNSCKEFAVMKSILQPTPYQFLSMQNKWLPAQFYLESQKLTEEQERERMREERDRRLRERNTPANRPATPGGADTRRTPPGTQPGRGRGGRGADNPMMEMMPPGPGGVVPGMVRPVRPTRTPADVEREANAAMIDEKTKLNSLKELIVWVHDDSVKAGAAYKYRIRLGVFNPIAGKDWFAPENKQFKEQTILWSGFTEIGDTIRVPNMLHMFPSEVLADKTGVAFDVFRYYMGQWHTESFDVRFGQMIGKQKEAKARTNTGDGMPGMGMPMMPMMEGGMNPNIMGPDGQSLMVDYSTGYMLLDVQQWTNWIIPGLRPQEVSTVLYLDRDNQILTLPTKKSYWPKDLQEAYNTVKSEYSKASGVMLDGGGMMMPGPGGYAPDMTTRVQDYGGL